MRCGELARQVMCHLSGEPYRGAPRSTWKHLHLSSKSRWEEHIFPETPMVKGAVFLVRGSSGVVQAPGPSDLTLLLPTKDFSLPCILFNQQTVPLSSAVEAVDLTKGRVLSVGTAGL